MLISLFDTPEDFVYYASTGFQILLSQEIGAVVLHNN